MQHVEDFIYFTFYWDLRLKNHNLQHQTPEIMDLIKQMFKIKCGFQHIHEEILTDPESM